MTQVSSKEAPHSCLQRRSRGNPSLRAPLSGTESLPHQAINDPQVLPFCSDDLRSTIPHADSAARQMRSVRGANTLEQRETARSGEASGAAGMHRVCKTPQGFCCMLGLQDEILPLLDKNQSFLHFFSPPLLAFCLVLWGFFNAKTPQCSSQPRHLSKMLSPAPACGSEGHGAAPESMGWAQG